ncbi:FMN-binding protein MioC [Aeromonas sp. 2HA2]|nr:FMN-binding protein MioC [Aeromonas sp. 5HA1]MDF2410859.1 FMN-binding protein MioC [Aeromonas sp. 2HA2]
MIPKLYPYLSTPFGGRIRLSVSLSELRIHSMAKLNLVVGSMLGAAEYVADHVANLLEQAGHQAEIHNPASLTEVLAEPDAILLVVTSTHGAGDVPDNLQPFAKDLAEQHPDLNALKYGVIALGDSSYDTFCQGGKTLDLLLSECGASRIGDRLDIDVTQHEIPEDAAEAWIQGWMQMIA